MYKAIDPTVLEQFLSKKFYSDGVVKNGTRLKTHIEQCLLCPKLLKQKFVDESCRIMNESDSENLKKKAVYYN